VADLAELNRLFSAWVQAGYHRGVHSETGEPPLARWARGVPDPLPLPSPAQLREAFLWSERRTVTKTATVSLHGNVYQVDASLVRRVIELVFDPLSQSSDKGSYADLGVIPIFTFSGRRGLPEVGIMQAAVIHALVRRGCRGSRERCRWAGSVPAAVRSLRCGQEPVP
jgi:hypothetical protein